jgi:hypothetical protein
VLEHTTHAMSDASHILRAAPAVLPFGAFLGMGKPIEFVVTRGFVEVLANEGGLHLMARPGFRFVVPVSQCAQYEGRVVDGFDLGEIVHAGIHSKTDVEHVAKVLGVGLEYARVLALAMRIKRLCTEDQELWHLGSVVGAEVYDREAWMERFGSGPRGRKRRR